MGFTNDALSDSLTPGRRTRLVFDVADTQLVEPAWAETRFAHQIRLGRHEGLGESYGVQRMQSGLLGLLPLNAEIHYTHESEAGEAAIMGAAVWNRISGLVEKPTFSPAGVLPGLAGAVSAAVKAAVGDRFFTPEHEAGESWDKGLATGLVAPPVPRSDLYGSEANVKLNRVAESTETHAPDTGYLLRWYQPGNPFERHDLTFRFYFGGSLSPEGHGRFCVTLSGTGRAYLHERISGTWIERDQWQFCNPQDAINVQHWLKIIPHGELYLEFQSQVSDKGLPAIPQRGAISRETSFSDQTSFTHQVEFADRERRDPASFRFVTGAGQPRWDMRADSRPMFQVARLVYPLAGAGISGQVVDQPMQVPWSVGGAALGQERPISVAVQWLAGPDIEAHGVTLALYNADTNVELAPGSTGDYLPPGGGNGIIPVLSLSTSDPYHSPYLRSYYAARDPVVAVIAPGEWTSDVTGTSIVGTGTDPSTESASFRVHDLAGELDRLRNRGGIPFEARCVLDEVEEIVLFRGRLRYSSGRYRPHDARSSVSANWHDYEIEGEGMWHRLMRSIFPPRIINFSKDLDDNLDEPWKVTDVIRYCFALAGFLADRVDVPDYPMRIWASGVDQATTSAAWFPGPGTPIGPYIVRTAYDYLGARILFDPNAGTNGGMWRLRLQPQPGATPLYNFIDDPVAGIGGPVLVHHKAAYDANTWIILREGSQSSLVEWTEFAENSAVLVTAPSEARAAKGGGFRVMTWAINPAMVTVPMWGTVADPDSPDYTDGGFYPAMDALDYVPPGDAGRRFVQWRCRRLYDQACRSRRLKRFSAPVDFVEDPSDALLFGRKRLLRYGDTITVNGVECFVTNYCVMYTDDIAQKACIEAQEFNAPVETVL